MKKLIKGDLVMTNVADKDIDMYLSAGWKLEIKKQQKNSKKTAKKENLDVNVPKVEDDKDSTGSDIIEE